MPRSEPPSTDIANRWGLSDLGDQWSKIWAIIPMSWPYPIEGMNKNFQASHLKMKLLHKFTFWNFPWNTLLAAYVLHVQYINRSQVMFWGYGGEPNKFRLCPQGVYILVGKTDVTQVVIQINVQLQLWLVLYNLITMGLDLVSKVWDFLRKFVLMSKGWVWIHKIKWSKEECLRQREYILSPLGRRNPSEYRVLLESTVQSEYEGGDVWSVEKEGDPRGRWDQTMHDFKGRKSLKHLNNEGCWCGHILHFNKINPALI